MIRPRNGSAYAKFCAGDPRISEDVVRPILSAVGAFLNDEGGAIKLTPDFGRFAGLADILGDYTDHVLGVSAARGGCGGKSSFSATGVTSAFHRMASVRPVMTPVTLIGAAGAMGRGTLEALLDSGRNDLMVCDIAYDAGTAEPPTGCESTPAVDGRFTDVCLARGGHVIATTWGGELARSNWDRLPAGATSHLAPNLALPGRDDTVAIDAASRSRDVMLIPGQFLTFGGALTSRLEWFSRCGPSPRQFDKPLAHELVRRTSEWWMMRSRPSGRGDRPTTSSAT